MKIEHTTVPSQQREPSFEEKLGELEQIVQMLEAGDRPLEESIRLYERGEQARKTCLQILNSFEERIRVLKIDLSGEPVLEEAGASASFEDFSGAAHSAPAKPRATRKKPPLAPPENEDEGDAILDDELPF